jgi:hypothetical protein
LRALRDIANDIEIDWNPIRNEGAKQALARMKSMGLITEPFYHDPNGYGVVASFLSNSVGWKGPVARRIKKELRVLCGHPRP